MQQLMVRNMNEHYAKEILNWKYESPYDFYNLNADSIKELIENEYYGVIDMSNQELIGFYCLGKSAQVPTGSQFGAYSKDFIDVGVGMKPEFTGRGNGNIFFSFILNQIQKDTVKPIRLTVAQFNHRLFIFMRNLILLRLFSL